MDTKHGTPVEWLVPLAFCLTGSWLVWHAPAFILDFGPENGQLFSQYERTDVLPNLPSAFGGLADWMDWAALILTPLLFILGVMTVRRAPMEFEDWRAHDRIAVFIGRVTMMLIAAVCAVMLFEVFMRYVMNDGTIWANELTLWLAGFVFLFAGLYAMQQRSHIRIFLLYDMCPRWLQRLFDTVSTLLICLFAFCLVYGGYGEALAKFMRWELFGTAFDPPLPATVKITILIVVSLVALQSVANLFADWHAQPVKHTAADDIDQDELEKLKAAVGAKGTQAFDVTRGAHQHAGD